VFDQRQHAGKSRRPAALLSAAGHGLFVLALIFRPLHASIVKPSDIPVGHGAVVTELVYAAPLELRDRRLDRVPYRKPVTRKIGKTQVANPVADPLQAGSEKGSFAGRAYRRFCARAGLAHRWTRCTAVVAAGWHSGRCDRGNYHRHARQCC